MKEENILGVNVSIIDYDTLYNKAKEDIDSNRKSNIIAINPEKILKAKKDNELLKLLNTSTYKIPDGIGVIYASKLKKGKIRKRITGIDSMELLLSLASKNNYKVFLYGAKKETVSKTSDVLKSKYKVNVVGYIDGYEKDNDKIIKTINDSKADIIFVALGSPKQEYWIKDNMNNLCPKVFQGVGGSFDVLSGNIKRAPSWMQKMGLEWFYRLIKEPKRIGRQIKLFGFLIQVIFSKGGKNEKN